MTPHTTLAVKKKSKTYGLLNSDSIPFYQYELYSVVCHQGTMETGHYKSFCKIKKEWYMFDDHHVKSVDEEQVLKQVPYMCFYIRSHCEYLDSSSVKTE
jgi:ubiquitin carboxyl-terminal hydrolase 22/27/51